METTALAAQLRAQRAFYRVMTISTPGGHLIQRAGAQAAILASAPDQATPNGVVGERGAVRTALGAVAAAYDAAGVRAWMVWLCPGDDATPAALAAAGLRLAGEPALMGAALEDLDLEPRGAIELADDSSWGMVGRLVDRANDIPAAVGFESFMREIDGGAPVRRYVAMADGEPAACVVAHADAGNVAVYCAATVARARGAACAASACAWRCATRATAAAGRRRPRPRRWASPSMRAWEKACSAAERCGSTGARADSSRMTHGASR